MHLADIRSQRMREVEEDTMSDQGPAEAGCDQYAILAHLPGLRFRLGLIHARSLQRRAIVAARYIHEAVVSVQRLQAQLRVVHDRGERREHQVDALLLRQVGALLHGHRHRCVTMWVHDDDVGALVRLERGGVEVEEELGQHEPLMSQHRHIAQPRTTEPEPFVRIGQVQANRHEVAVRVANPRILVRGTTTAELRPRGKQMAAMGVQPPMPALGQGKLALPVEALEGRGSLLVIVVGEVVEDVVVQGGIVEARQLDHHLLGLFDVLRLLDQQGDVAELQQHGHLFQSVAVALGDLRSLSDVRH